MSKKNRTEPEALNLPAFGIDTHAHIDTEHFAGRMHEVLDRALNAGLKKIGVVFLGLKSYQTNRALLEDRKECFFLIGCHPCHAHTITDNELVEYELLCKTDSRIKAIGEIGLDFYHDISQKKTQEEIFRKQLALAKRCNLPVAIHSRQSHEETIEILIEEGFSQKKVLWHFFMENEEITKKVIDNGWHVSIPGAVTYKGNNSLTEHFKNIPIDRLMIETDSPYVAPEPWRGKENHPALLVFVAQKLAEIRNEETAFIWKKTAENAQKFFNLTD